MSGELCALWIGLVSLATACAVRLRLLLVGFSAVEGATPSRAFLPDDSPLNFEILAASRHGAHATLLQLDLRWEYPPTPATAGGVRAPQILLPTQNLLRDRPSPDDPSWRTFRRIETILVAYDGSPQSQHALQIALSLAKMASSKVLVFSVVQVPKPALRAELNAVLDDGREGYERSFVAIREQAKESEIELDTEIAVGRPADQIIYRAETFQASLIVMGRRKKPAVEHWIRGSSSERVLRYARCPVMLVR